MKRVLVAPLDWGLGHATRCIPVIRELQAQGCEVLLAGSGDSLLLLQGEFPHLRSFSLPGYCPRYPVQGSMVWTMARQLPRFINAILLEHRAVENICRNENIGLLISDNRYGCWSARIPCVFITHQSNIMMPRRFGWLQNPVRRLNEKIMARFTVCWIPDYPDAHSLAGDLLKTGMQKLNTKREFIGPLSRFTPRPHPVKKYDVVAVFSGPEPQRTLLEMKVVPQLKASGVSYCVIRGLVSLKAAPTDEHTFNFLLSNELQACVESAGLVIARSGYSSIMDLHALGRKAVFIPTPGQTEQEYLAARLMKKGIAFYMRQDAFDLRTALQTSENYAGFRPSAGSGLLREAVASILDSNIDL